MASLDETHDLAELLDHSLPFRPAQAKTPVIFTLVQASLRIPWQAVLLIAKSRTGCKIR